MTLLDICEPLFQYICRLNRAAKVGTSPDYGIVRGEIFGLLEGIERDAQKDAKLARQYSRLDRALTYFVDSIISQSRLRFSGEWHQNRIAYAQQDLAGDERFFDLMTSTLDEVKKTNNEEIKEVLAVYYVCLCLGFTGMYEGNPQKIKELIDQIFPWIKPLMDSDPRKRICDEAYNPDKRILHIPPTSQVGFIIVLFIFLTLSAFVVYFGLYSKATNQLSGSLRAIIGQ